MAQPGILVVHYNFIFFNFLFSFQRKEMDSSTSVLEAVSTYYGISVMSASG